MEDVSLITPEDLHARDRAVAGDVQPPVIDLSKGYTQNDLAAMSIATQILLVTQMDLPCLRNVVRLLTSLGAMEGMGEKIKIVVNRVGLGDGQISLKKAQETIGREIFWQLPNDYRTMIEVRNNGVPLVEQAPKAAMRPSRPWPRRCRASRKPRPLRKSRANGQRRHLSASSPR